MTELPERVSESKRTDPPSDEWPPDADTGERVGRENHRGERNSRHDATRASETTEVHTERPLRILHIVESMGTGVLQVVRVLANTHSRAGASVTVAYGQRPETPDDVRGLFDSAVDLRRIPWEHRTVAAQLRALTALRRVVRATTPDVVHLHSTFAGLVGLIAVRGQVPTIFTPHAFASTMSQGGALRRRLILRVEKELVARSTVLGAVSRSEAQTARVDLGATNVQQIDNGIPELDPGKALVRPTLTSHRPQVVAAGRIAPQRQPAAVAEILDAISDIADVSWIGAAPPGSGHDRPLIEAGIPISGWLSRQEAFARVDRADVYLHFTAWDGQAISILEAMSRDLAVVASDIPAAGEILPESSLASDSVDAIALLRELLSSPDRLEAHREAQRQLRGRFSAAQMTDRWMTLYRQTAARRPAHLRVNTDDDVAFAAPVAPKVREAPDATPPP